MLAVAGIIFWLYIVENYLIKKTKRIFTIISTVSFIISIIALLGPVSREFALNIQYILLPFSLGAIAILYFYIIAKTTGDLRNKAIWILIGLVLIALAQILDSEAFITAFPSFPLEITPIIMIIGIFIFLFSQSDTKRKIISNIL